MASCINIKVMISSHVYQFVEDHLSLLKDAAWQYVEPPNPYLKPRNSRNMISHEEKRVKYFQAVNQRKGGSKMVH